MPLAHQGGMEPQEVIDRLAEYEPGPHPFVSVYIDARPDQTGRNKFRAFVRSELTARAATYQERSPERQSLDHDVARILPWLDREAAPQANALAIFACSGAGVFETVQLAVPIDETEVFVAPVPHLYPLAAIADRYRRHAAVVLDTHSARIFVFGLGDVISREAIESDSMPKTEAGGWSQARYQRHVENFQQQHAKDVVDTLDRLVRDERVDRIVVAANDVALPLFRAALPRPLADRVTEVGDLDVRSPRDRIFQRTLEAAREMDARDDAERVRRVLDAYRAGGLGIVGVDATLRALTNGQVHELLLSADPRGLRARDGRQGAELADELVAKARQTDATITFIEDASLLAEAGGVGGLLRFRVRKAA
jgi:peptide chain release factor subunit 1